VVSRAPHRTCERAWISHDSRLVVALADALGVGYNMFMTITGVHVQPCGHAAEVRRSARFPPQTGSVTGGYRRFTHLRLVTAHAHDVLLVPLRLTDRVCNCRVGRLRDYLQERRAVCDCDTGLTEAYRRHVRGRRVVLHEYIPPGGPIIAARCPERTTQPPLSACWDYRQIQIAEDFACWP
jgi:hypothetical protein